MSGYVPDWAPDWATHYFFVKPGELSDCEYMATVTFYGKNDIRDYNEHHIKPISELTHDLAVSDVLSQMKDKPLADRIDADTYDLKAKVADQINPAHYKQGDVECIDAIESALTPDEFRGYCKGNILKYTWRERYKQGATALQKAQWYLERLLKVMG